MNGVTPPNAFNLVFLFLQRPLLNGCFITKLLGHRNNEDVFNIVKTYKIENKMFQTKKKNIHLKMKFK